VRKYLLIIAFIILSLTPCLAQNQTGMVFGKNHAFYFTAPQGWVLDNKSGVSQGLHMVFYPAGETWANSPVVAYGRSCTKDDQIKTIEDQIERTIKDFHLHGSPNYKGKRQPSIFLSNGKEIVISYFEGDRWGNYEAVGYIEEEETINFLVFTSRTKSAFDQQISSFKRLLASYKNVYPKSQDKLGRDDFVKMVTKAKQCVSSSNGKAYEKNLLDSLGTNMATFMRDCTSYLSEGESSNFEMVFKVEQSGRISEAFVKPMNTLSICFRGLILGCEAPRHNFDIYLQHIDMRIK
jgi:hypothetical protein